MIEAVLYSDQIIPANRKVDRRLLDLMEPRGRTIGYVASGPEPDRRFFNERHAYYDRLGLELAHFHDLDAPPDPARTAALLACDAIHLAGGDTLAFLRRLERSGMLGVLRDWALGGGLLIGASAGAILMTPHIAVDAIFRNQPPEALTEGAALGLVPFEFFPHLQVRDDYLARLRRYSRHTPRPILACEDGDGMVVTDGMAEGVGTLLRIADGVVTPLAADRIAIGEIGTDGAA